jgi:hypothetical protein
VRENTRKGLINPLPSGIFEGSVYGMGVDWLSRNDDIKLIKDNSGDVTWADRSSP